MEGFSDYLIPDAIISKVNKLEKYNTVALFKVGWMVAEYFSAMEPWNSIYLNT